MEGNDVKMYFPTKKDVLEDKEEREIIYKTYTAAKRTIEVLKALRPF